MHLPETVAVIGLGYVGLPLAVSISKHFSVIGFDLTHPRIVRLENSFDDTDGVSLVELTSQKILTLRCYKKTLIRHA